MDLTNEGQSSSSFRSSLFESLLKTVVLVIFVVTLKVRMTALRALIIP